MLWFKLKTKRPESIFMSEKISLLYAPADYRINSELQGTFSRSHFSLCSVARAVGNTSFRASSMDANDGMSF